MAKMNQVQFQTGMSISTFMDRYAGVTTDSRAEPYLRLAEDQR